MTITVLWGGSVFLLLALSSVVGFVYIRQRRRDDAVTRATFIATQAAGIPTYRALRQQIPAEFDRARRYGHQLVVLVIKLQTTEDGQAVVHGHDGNGGSNGNGKDRQELITKLLLNASFVSYVLRDGLRSSDLVSYDAELDRFVIALPEIERPQAEQFIHRHGQRAQELLGVRLRAGVAGFPTDGLALEELVAIANAQCVGRDPTSGIVGPASQPVQNQGVAAQQELA